MRKQTRLQGKLSGNFFLFVIAALISAGCGNATTTPTSTTATSASESGTSSTSTSSTLAISPSSITLSEGASYYFTATGGSGSGYSFAMGNGGSVAGSVTSAGYFTAVSGWAGTTYIVLTDSAGDAVFATVHISGSSTTTTGTTALSISPSSVTVNQSAAYTFSATGGSGTYTYSVPSGEGSISSSTGYYVAPSSWTGTTSVEVEDSDGNVAYASVTVASTTVYSMTATLQNCEGIAGGTTNSNNWQVNGQELRTINDSNNSTESPVYCMGLSAAVPSTATVMGMSVGIFLINQSSSTDGSELQTLTLIYGGGLLGAEKSLYLPIPGNKAAFPTFTEGGSTDTWSAALTPSIMNSASFGIDIQTYRGNDRLFTGVSGSILPLVTIYYTL